MSDYSAARFRQDLKDNDGARYEIKRISAESRQQRKFYHGGVLTLWAYLNGYDYRDSDVLEWMHEEAKREFNGKVVMRDGKPTKRGESTKGELSQGYVDRIVDYLEENYGIDRMQVLDPEHFKDFRDRVYMDGKFDTYIDYLKFLKRLK